MIHLAKHIELLLLENDCVIIPRLGGFVAHYAPAQYIEKEQTIIPPYRTIGFNSQLKINDGVLTESYMNLYGINFNEAHKRMDSEIDELLSVLHENGKYNFDNIGELHYNIYGVFEFKPYDNKLTSPDLYGLSTLQLKELSSEVIIPAAPIVQDTPVTSTSDEVKVEEPITKNINDVAEYDEDDDDNNSKAYIIRLNRTFVRSAVAVAAILVLMFAFSTPIENSTNITDNQAQLVPNEIVQHLKENSILCKMLDNKAASTAKKETSDIANKPLAKTEKEPAKENTQLNKPTPTTESKAEPQPTETDKRYQLIVASSITKKQAAILANDLKEDGYSDAKVLISGKMVRVRIAESDDSEQAQSLLNKISKKSAYKNAWIMKKRSSSDK